MLVKELKEYLTRIPDSAKVFYEDMNFGGAARELSFYDIKYDKQERAVLISSELWEPCD